MKESKPVADALAAVAGLRWKIWLVNELGKTSGVGETKIISQRIRFNEVNHEAILQS